MGEIRRFPSEPETSGLIPLRQKTETGQLTAAWVYRNRPEPESVPLIKIINQPGSAMIRRQKIGKE
jgi:hypothetical protein